MAKARAQLAPVSATILCPGPSLNKVNDAQITGVVYCVNAAVFRPCDWWCAMDQHVYGLFGNDPKFIHPRVGYAGTVIALRDPEHTCWDILKGFRPAQGRQTIDLHRESYERFGAMDRSPWGQGACHWSSTAVLFLACVIHGHKSVRIFGADMVGTSYFATVDGANLVTGGEDRWAPERRDHAACIEWLTRFQGVTIDKQEAQ